MVHSLLDRALAERRLVLYTIGVWTTHDGVEIPVGKMTTSHLCNVLCLLRTWARKKCNKMNVHPNSPEPQGEMAQDGYWQEFDRWLHYDLDDILGTHPFYQHLIRELNTR